MLISKMKVVDQDSVPEAPGNVELSLEERFLDWNTGGPSINSVFWIEGLAALSDSLTYNSPNTLHC